MNPSELDSLLRSAGASPELPEDFASTVWRRINAREAESRAIRTASPWTAAAAIAATIILGLWLGALSRPDLRHGRADYVRSISPFANHGAP